MRPRHTIQIDFMNADSPTARNRYPLELHFGEGVSREIVATLASRLEYADEIKSVTIRWASLVA